MFTFTHNTRVELVEFLKNIGVQDLSDRAVESYANDIDDEGHLEVSGRYTEDGIPATHRFA